MDGDRVLVAGHRRVMVYHVPTNSTVIQLTANGALKTPVGVVVSSTGLICVSDSYHNGVIYVFEGYTDKVLRRIHFADVTKPLRQTKSLHPADLWLMSADANGRIAVVCDSVRS